jgi:hypothetical protein
MILAFSGCSTVSPVREGVLYRTGQLSTTQLEKVVNDHGIRTVVNLRGREPGAVWYRDQVRLLENLNVRHIDLPMGDHEPSEDTVAELLDIYRNEPKPILVQSRFSKGAAGLASGLYRAGIEHDSSDRARKELAPWQTKWLPFVPGSAHDKFLADWQGGGNTKYRAAKPTGRNATQNLLDEFRLPDPEKNAPGEARGSRASERDDEQATVVLGPPRVTSTQRTADRSFDLKGFEFR